MMIDAMSDIETLSELRKLGQKYRNQPLETFSDESLIKELEKRGWFCHDNRIESINLNLELPAIEWGEL